MKGLIITGLIIFAFSVACNNLTDSTVVKLNRGKTELTDLNRYLVQKDRERIQNYIERKNLPMKESETGLWYWIKKEGAGKFLSDNDKILMNYKCSLLDGTEIYNSDKLGPKEFVLGKSDIEAGLNEGLRLVKRGGEAIFILPPFLAHGLVGDGKSIPSRAVLVYNIEILNGK
jgi:FKBP-type peptidyl-prolyl cis-trans isomerase FkpA